MPTIAEVRGGLAAAVTAGTSLRCDKYETDNVVAPCVQVGRNAYDPRLTHGGTKAAHRFRLRHYVPRTADVQGQAQLDEASETSGSASIKAAVENDANWGSVDVDYAEVVQVGEIVEVQRGETTLFMVEYDVEVVF